MSTLKTPQVAKSIIDMQGRFSYTPYRKKEVLIKSSTLYLKDVNRLAIQLFTRPTNIYTKEE